MEYTITHTDKIEAESAEEAKESYIEQWQAGLYNKLDLDISPEE